MREAFDAASDESRSAGPALSDTRIHQSAASFEAQRLKGLPDSLWGSDHKRRERGLSGSLLSVVLQRFHMLPGWFFQGFPSFSGALSGTTYRTV